MTTDTTEITTSSILQRFNLHRYVDLSRFIDQGILAPSNPHPGSGFRHRWTEDDLRDLARAMAWLAVVRTHRTDKSHGVTGVLAKALELWRDCGRPERLMIASVGGTPALLTEGTFCEYLRTGLAVIAVAEQEIPEEPG